jgi:hypothetical protein
MATLPQLKDLHFWAWCPHCPEQAHTAGFPITAKVYVDIDWQGRDIHFRTEVDTQQIRQHMTAIHPDIV